MTRLGRILLLTWLAVSLIWGGLIVLVAQGVRDDYSLPASWGNIGLTAEIALLPPLALLILGYLMRRSK